VPGVNWDVFAGLPGAAETNFEMLCRGLIRRHYGHCGDFRARAAQPGVEFHLKLHTACAQLGEPGRWWGWQCRWYGLGPGIPLGSTRRAKIKRAIATTLAEVGVLTDWVLWTRHPLTAGDQDWFYGLDAGGMRLHLWTVAEADDLLSGPAEILRETYFGELVLRAEDLVDLHERSIAPIRARWLPEAHQVVDAERTVRRTLAGRQTRHDLRTIADQLAKAENQLAQAAADQPDPISEQIKRLQALCAATVQHMAAVNTALQHGHLETVRDQIGQTPVLNAEDHAALRALRNTRQPCAPAATNATADVRLTGRLLSDLRERLDAHAVAVVAGAGCGKTQLAAQLTAPEADRPAGILLHGRELNAGASLDDLARRFTIRARPCPSMEAMIEAVDAAGQRAGRRLPIVIDALNEAEDPRDWKPLLASLSVMLEDCPYVVFICTVRPEFKDECLPDNFPQVEIPSFGADTLDAVRRYFAYYKIDASDAVLPVGILRHPLSLRLFCEVTNPRREKVVGVEAIPASLTAVFDRYLEQVAERISTLSPRHCRVYPPEISDALEKIGVAMWEHRTRSIEFGELRDLLGDHGAWDCSIVRALEHEGVLLRQPGQTPGTHVMAASYDALAGHLIASAVLARRDRNGARDWIQDSATVEALTAEPPTRHPLASDVLAALAALLPRRQQRQLWPIIDPQLRRQALREAAGLEAQLLDAATIDELAKLARQTTPGLPDMFWRLWETRAAPAHPLNAGFLDTVLRPMNVADRDLRWTEWVRSNQREILADLHDLERRWRASSDRHDSDALLAHWVTWLLTSTVRRLRDQATCCLYWYGRGSPAALFTLTLDKVGINDPYVTERLLAASYGVTMAHQVRGEILAAALPAYLTG